MEVDVRSNAIRENETFGILSLALLDRICPAACLHESRVVKLMAASRGSPRSDYGIRIREDLAISEVDETFRHFNLDGNDAGHPRIVDRLRKVHQTSTFRIKFSTGFDKPANRREHSDVGGKFVPIQLWIDASDVQEIGFRYFTIRER